jgi:hypothetical protein
VHELIKKFLALVGEGDSGKTSAIEDLVKDTNGFKLTGNSQISFCSINGAPILTINSSPQERNRSKVNDQIDADLEKLEEIAAIFNLNYFVVLMPFTTNVNTDANEEKIRIDGAIAHIKNNKGYEFDRIDKKAYDGLKLFNTLKAHRFFI